MTTHENVCLKAAIQLKEVKMSANDLFSKLSRLDAVNENSAWAEEFTKHFIQVNGIETYIKLLKDDIKKLEELLYLLG